MHFLLLLVLTQGRCSTLGLRQGVSAVSDQIRSSISKLTLKYMKWTGCGDSLASTAQRLPDIACESKGCLGVNDQACGGISAIAIWRLNPLQLQDCAFPGTIPNFRTPFQLNILFLDGEPTVPVTMTSINTHTNFGTSTRDAGILSVRLI